MDFKKHHICDFPGDPDGKESVCNSGDLDLIPGSGRSPGEINGNPLHYSCLGNPIDTRTWWAIVNGVVKNWTWLSNSTQQTHVEILRYFIPQVNLGYAIIIGFIGSQSVNNILFVLRGVSWFYGNPEF